LFRRLFAPKTIKPLQVYFQYPYSYTAVAMLLAALATWWLYRKFRMQYDAGNPAFWAMATCRFSALAIVALLVLVPFIRLIRTYLEPPIIAIGLDNSESLTLVDDSVLQGLEMGLEQITRSLDDYDIEYFVWGQGVGTGAWNHQETRTNIQSWLQFANNRYRYRNLGALLTVSDGVYNQGGNPQYSTGLLRAPHYIIALGDTTPPCDARIASVNFNDLAYKGNQFPIKVSAVAENLPKGDIWLALEHEGKELARQNLRIKEGKNFWEANFLAEAKEVGVQKYLVKLEHKPGELTYENNEYVVFVEVMDADKSILIAYDAPHPDVAALKRSLTRNRNFAVDGWWVNDTERKHEPADLGKYHLVITHNLPRANNPKTNKIFKESPALFMVFDNTVNFQAMNTLQQLIRVQAKGNSANEVSGTLNPQFSAFGLPVKSPISPNDYPPLMAPFADLAITGQHDVLLYQRIGLIDTKYPLLAIAQTEEKKMGFMAATGIWRWYMHGFAAQGNAQYLDDMIGQTVQFLATKEDKRRMRPNKSKYLFKETEDVVFTITYYDKNFNPSPNANVEMRAIDEEGKDYVFGFAPTGNYYEMNAGQLPPGEYAYTISGRLENDRHELKGRFTVSEVRLERAQPVANHGLLFQLANDNNGKLYYPHQLDELASVLKEGQGMVPIRHEKAQITELIHNKWLFVLVILLLTAEWILRKHNGAY
jgi:hypothetical protein